ncbi:MAG: hypothetical protein ABW157_03840 [Candidatus Thiodiazotropha sp. LLP2]
MPHQKGLDVHKSSYLKNRLLMKIETALLYFHFIRWGMAPPYRMAEPYCVANQK